MTGNSFPPVGSFTTLFLKAFPILFQSWIFLPRRFLADCYSTIKANALLPSALCFFIEKHLSFREYLRSQTLASKFTRLLCDEMTINKNESLLPERTRASENFYTSVSSDFLFSLAVSYSTAAVIVAEVIFSEITRVRSIDSSNLHAEPNSQ